MMILVCVVVVVVIGGGVSIGALFGSNGWGNVSRLGCGGSSCYIFVEEVAGSFVEVIAQLIAPRVREVL